MSLFTTILLFVAAAVNQVQSYDEDIATRLANFCGVVYCTTDESFGYLFENIIFDWECDTCGYLRQTSNIVTVYLIRDNSWWHDIEGMITYDDTNNAITVVFEGTDPTSAADIVTDISLVRVEYPPCGGYWWWEDDCTVHKGFYDAYLSVADIVYEQVLGLVNTYPSATLEITGHSLGGALAMLCALDLVENHDVSIVADYVYTFGQPRVGDDEFIDHYEQTFGSGKTIRVTHGNDPVPLVPWRTWGWNYLHNSQEIYYPGASDGNYQTCDGSGEDQSCIGQHDWWDIFTDFNIIDDHNEYLGVSYDCQQQLSFDTGLADGTTAGSNLDDLIIIQNETFPHEFNVILNWTEYGSVLYTAEAIEASIGLQTLLVYSLKEAAIDVRFSLEHDGQIGANITNVTDIGNNEILITVNAWFYDILQYKGFKIDLDYIIENFDLKLKEALRMSNDTGTIILSDDIEGILNGIETTLAPSDNEDNTGCDCDATGQTDSDELKNNDDELDEGMKIWLFIAIGIIVCVIIGYGVYRYKQAKDTRETREKSKELSNQDQFNWQNNKVNSISPR